MNAAAYNIVKAYGGKGINLGGLDPKAPFGGTGFRGAYAPESPNISDPVCAIVAIDAKSGKTLWRKNGVHGYTGCSLAIRGARAVYQTKGGLTCIDPKTGEKIWSVEKAISSGDGTAANTVVLTDDAVYAKEGKGLTAYSLTDGSERWKGPAPNNYEKAADLYFAAGTVWVGGCGKPTSLDPKTGEPITTITQKMTGPMGHDRCYRNFITERFYINSKTGGADFLTLDGKKEFPNYWLRGTCGLGVLPCNGLLYVPPFSCECSIGAMIGGFNAVYTEKDMKPSDQKIDVERESRLIKGPAFGKSRNPKSGIQNGEDWPTYRHDGARSGVTKSKVPPELKAKWKANFKTPPSALTVADGKVFVSEIDAHTVYALDAAGGSVVWDYVAGARVDSPPTYYRGTVLFGSRDGWVHCLRASDGELVWRFKDLPGKMIGAFGQLESAWPVCGSVLIVGDVAYFTAGRSSFLDGGIFVYALNPQTGEVLHSRQVFGPFQEGSGFPSTGSGAFKSDIGVSDGKLVHVRHRAFNPDLTDASTAPHLLPSAGFLDGTPQHRTFWTVGTRYPFTRVSGPEADIMVVDGRTYYGVLGFVTQRHSYFDPRVRGYKLLAATVGAAPKTPGQRGRRGEKGKGAAKAPAGKAKAPEGKWNADIPLTGKAMVLADGVLFVAGTPAHFPPGHPVAKYQAAYEGKLGGVLWAASADDGNKLGQYKLDAAPCWDGMAAANGRLYVTLKGGTVMCMEGE